MKLAHNSVPLSLKVSRIATDEDSEMKALKEIVFTEWPDSRSDVHQ